MNDFTNLFGEARFKNDLLWSDMERAYEFVEKLAPYSISGDVNAFLNAVMRARLRAALEDQVDPIPSRTMVEHTSVFTDVLSQVKSQELTQMDIARLILKKDTEQKFRKQAAEQQQTISATQSGRLFGYGTDGYGTYLPLHLLWPKYLRFWGIYISESRLVELAMRLLYRSGLNLQNSEMNVIKLLDVAYQIILRHELFHFKLEQWALVFELATGKPVYLPYLANVYLPTLYDQEDTNLEEAIANLSILLSRKINTFKKELPFNLNWAIEQEFLLGQGPGYRNYNLLHGYPKNLKGTTLAGTYRNVINYLCNQVVKGSIQPSDPLIPFFIYPPNNNFLRAEHLVPIYLVRNIPMEASVIGSTSKTAAFEIVEPDA